MCHENKRASGSNILNKRQIYHVKTICYFPLTLTKAF